MGSYGDAKTPPLPITPLAIGSLFVPEAAKKKKSLFLAWKESFDIDICLQKLYLSTIVTQKQRFKDCASVKLPIRVAFIFNRTWNYGREKSVHKITSFRQHNQTKTLSSLGHPTGDTAKGGEFNLFLNMA